MALTTKQKVLIGGALAVAGLYGYKRWAETDPFLAGVVLGAAAMIFGPAALDWALEIGRRARPPRAV